MEKNAENIALSIYRTHVLDYNNYVDLSSINGVTRTQLFTKQHDPNVFRLLEDLEGDQFDEVIERWMNKNEQKDAV